MAVAILQSSARQPLASLFKEGRPGGEYHDVLVILFWLVSEWQHDHQPVAGSLTRVSVVTQRLHEVEVGADGNVTSDLC